MRATANVPAPASAVACSASGLVHRYGEIVALDNVDLKVQSGEIVAVLGQNGSGKTTLFRLLGTLLPIQHGRVTIDGIDVSTQPMVARQRLGIIFQSPSLDIKLTVVENLRCQGALYGLRGSELASRIDAGLIQFGLGERRNDLCQTLSGGLKRRVELAKGLLHRPRVMLLDEPSTGLDPAARLQLWEALTELSQSGVAVILTTHLMEEAAKATRVVLMHEGRKVDDATPSQLRSQIAGRVLTIVADNPELAGRQLSDSLGLATRVVGESLRAACDDPAMVARVAESLGDSVHSIMIGRPTLEDVFISQTVGAAP